MKKTGDVCVFTLIELMVVIGVIAILAALLLPVLGKSRNRAYQSNCTALLKQYQLATDSYTNDYNEYYPDARNHLKPTDGGILGYLATGKEKWVEGYARCPGDLKTEELGRLGDFSAYETKVSIGCSENTLSDSARMTRFGPMAFWRCRPQFKTKPSKMMTWADWQNNPYDSAPTAAMVKPAAANNMGSLCFRHNNMSNIAMQDGHVGIMRLKDIESMNDGHDLAPDADWGIGTAVGKMYKMYYPFGPPPENASMGLTEREWPTMSYE